MSMSNNAKPERQKAPALRAIDPWSVGNPKGRFSQLLSPDEQARLASISMVMRFEKGENIYVEGDVCDSLFNVVSGVVATYRIDAHGERRISAFHQSDDLFGLSEEGRYVDAAKAINSVVVHAISTTSLRRILTTEGHLSFQFLVTLTQNLRRAEDHEFLLSQTAALTRIALFLAMQEHLQAARNEPASEVFLPMNRSDIAEYTGLSLSALSRGFAELTRRGVIRARDLHHVRVLDGKALDQIAGRTMTGAKE
jgi:CRP/FNR family transcriptional regulator